MGRYIARLLYIIYAISVIHLAGVGEVGECTINKVLHTIALMCYRHLKGC